MNKFLFISLIFRCTIVQSVLNKQIRIIEVKKKKEEEKEERDFTTIIHAQFTPVIASLSAHDHDKKELN